MNEADRAKIRKNTVQLVEDLELTDVLDHLLALGTITRAQHEELMPTTKAERRNKVREFLGVLSRRGPSAFKDFCDVLIATNQIHLVELLCPERVPLRVLEKGQPNEPPASTAEPKPCDEQIIDTVLQEVSQEALQEYRQKVRLNKVYEMTTTRGRALVINNEYFSEARARNKNLRDREGTMNDAINLNGLFSDLKFVNVQECNQTAQGMREVIENETRNEDHSKYGMFVLVILSHGEKGAVYGVDGELLKISDIKKLLGARRFSRMANKPKLVLLQACQGEKPDGRLEHDGAETDAAPPRDSATGAEFADMLVSNATSPGYVSYRDVNSGTWFIRAVVDVFRRASYNTHVADMLTEVRRRVDTVSRENNRAQGAYDVDHLLKALYLLPGWSGP